MIGFGQRVKNELERLAVKGTKIKIFAPPERKYTTWIGGSILAALGTFRKVYLSLMKALTSRCGLVQKNTRKIPKYTLLFECCTYLDYPSQGNLSFSIWHGVGDSRIPKKKRIIDYNI